MDEPRDTSWHAFDYDAKDATAPPVSELVWIVEEFYVKGVSLGVFDGFTFRMWDGSDDCSVTHWARIAYPPEPPA